jgi:hypothetical protein
MNVPYDHAFDQAWRFNIRFRGVLPFPVTTEGASDINYGTGHKSMKKDWYRRLGVLRYRSVTETSRILHYLLGDRVLVQAALERARRPWRRSG